MLGSEALSYFCCNFCQQSHPCVVTKYDLPRDCWWHLPRPPPAVLPAAAAADSRQPSLCLQAAPADTPDLPEHNIPAQWISWPSSHIWTLLWKTYGEKCFCIHRSTIKFAISLGHFSSFMFPSFHPIPVYITHEVWFRKITVIKMWNINKIVIAVSMRYNIFLSSLQIYFLYYLYKYFYTCSTQYLR